MTSGEFDGGCNVNIAANSYLYVGSPYFRGTPSNQTVYLNGPGTIQMNGDTAIGYAGAGVPYSVVNVAAGTVFQLGWHRHRGQHHLHDREWRTRHQHEHHRRAGLHRLDPHQQLRLRRNDQHRRNVEAKRRGHRLDTVRHDEARPRRACAGPDHDRRWLKPRGRDLLDVSRRQRRRLSDDPGADGAQAELGRLHGLRLRFERERRNHLRRRADHHGAVHHSGPADRNDRAERRCHRHGLDVVPVQHRRHGRGGEHHHVDDQPGRDA